MHLTVSRPALVNCTNVYTKDIQSPWTILQQAGTKRPAIEQQNGGLKKRVKVSSNKEQQQEHNLVDDEDSDEDSESDAEMEDVVDVVARARRGAAFRVRNAAAMGIPGSRHGLCASFYSCEVL